MESTITQAIIIEKALEHIPDTKEKNVAREFTPEERQIFDLARKNLKPEIFERACKLLHLPMEHGYPDLDKLYADVGPYGEEYMKSNKRAWIDRLVASRIPHDTIKQQQLLREERESMEKNHPNFCDMTKPWNPLYTADIQVDPETGIKIGKPKLQCLINIPQSQSPREYATFLKEHRDEASFMKFEELIDSTDPIGSIIEILETSKTWEQVKGKLKDDPRSTPIGRIIRGDMDDEKPQIEKLLSENAYSLVGPRAMSAGAFKKWKEEARIGKEPQKTLIKMLQSGQISFSVVGDLYAIIKGVELRHTVTDDERAWLSLLSGMFMNMRTHLRIITEVAAEYKLKRHPYLKKMAQAMRFLLPDIPTYPLSEASAISAD